MHNFQPFSPKSWTFIVLWAGKLLDVISVGNFSAHLVHN